MDDFYKKLKFKSRRGMLELDLILQKYLLNNYDKMPIELKNQLAEFLDLNDPELFDLLINKYDYQDTKFIKYADIIENIKNT
jgi:succinate dehydrogenase flavin-adding protein (antitoxin of CptAB toxin-antitoxin module)